MPYTLLLWDGVPRRSHHWLLGELRGRQSAEEAFSRTEILGEMAEIYYRIRIAAHPILLTPEQVEEVAAKMADCGQAKLASAN